jgi:hypothetical protein
MNVSFLQIYNEKIYDLLNPVMFKKGKGDNLDVNRRKMSA